MNISIEFREALDNLMTMALLIQRTDMGIIQLLDRQTGLLKIVAQQGFNSPFLEHFKEVSIDDNSAYGRAFRTKEIVTIEDVTGDILFTPHKLAAISAGFISVQSVPLITSTNIFQGVLSMHFRSKRKIKEEDLATIREYGQQAADIISAFTKI